MTQLKTSHVPYLVFHGNSGVRPISHALPPGVVTLLELARLATSQIQIRTLRESLTQTLPNTPPLPTALTLAVPQAPTLRIAASSLWMVWSIPWMAEDEDCPASAHTFTFNTHCPRPQLSTPLEFATKCQHSNSLSSQLISQFVSRYTCATFAAKTLCSPGCLPREL